MNFVLKTSNFVSKTRDFVLQMMNFAADGLGAGRRAGPAAATCVRIRSDPNLLVITAQHMHSVLITAQHMHSLLTAARVLLSVLFHSLKKARKEMAVTGHAIDAISRVVKVELKKYLLRGICIHNKSYNLPLILGLNYALRTDWSRYFKARAITTVDDFKHLCRNISHSVRPFSPNHCLQMGTLHTNGHEIMLCRTRFTAHFRSTVCVMNRRLPFVWTDFEPIADHGEGAEAQPGGSRS